MHRTGLGQGRRRRARKPTCSSVTALPGSCRLQAPSGTGPQPMLQLVQYLAQAASGRARMGTGGQQGPGKGPVVAEWRRRRLALPRLLSGGTGCLAPQLAQDRGGSGPAEP